jgi:hypothetical protein
VLWLAEHNVLLDNSLHPDYRPPIEDGAMTNPRAIADRDPSLLAQDVSRIEDCVRADMATLAEAQKPSTDEFLEVVAQNDKLPDHVPRLHGLDTSAAEIGAKRQQLVLEVLITTADQADIADR